MISITNIQKNIRRAEVWGNIPVLRCGSGSGKPEFFLGGVCDSEIPARIFGVFVVAVVVVVMTDIVLGVLVVVVYGFALLLRCFALSECFTFCFASNMQTNVHKRTIFFVPFFY